MRTHRLPLLTACLLASALLAPAARAQWAVIDAPAIVQLIQEVQTMEQQLQTARSQLSQAQQALQTMTGNRGMQQLLSGTVRNYLPSDWTQLSMAAAGGPGGLAADVKGNIAANAILSPQQLTLLSPGAQQLIVAARQGTALRQAIARQALANTSNRFASLQSLIAAIGSASDQKGILDLQARINAELGMLENEQTKLQVLSQSADAQDSMLQQQAREQAIAAHGNFAARLQPVP
jgi:type IV secretion system protein VirB5